MASKGAASSLPAVLSLLLAVACWGLAPVATRYLVTTDLTPLHLVLLRFTGSSLLCLPTLLQLRRQPLERSDWGRILLCGFFNVIGYNLIVAYGIRFIPASTASVIIATEPVWIMILSFILLHERVHWTTLLGLAISIIGVCLLIGWDTGGLTVNHTTLIGMGLTLLAAMMWGSYTVVVRPLSRKYGATLSTGLTTMIGTLPLLPCYNTQIGTTLHTFPLQAWGALLLLIVGSTVLSMILWNFGVASMPGTQAGLFLYLVPFVGMIGGNIFLHEQITPIMIISGLLTIIGVAIAQTKQLFRTQTKNAHLLSEIEPTSTQSENQA
ncbi:MAG TPA: DMT family transporter [Dictyobacter sp.]|jgi:drug/metabolite transporter (DMT)-like permease|nr:DMT family transporter [Dictyobacter sp.]